MKKTASKTNKKAPPSSRKSLPMTEWKNAKKPISKKNRRQPRRSQSEPPRKRQKTPAKKTTAKKTAVNRNVSIRDEYYDGQRKSPPEESPPDVAAMLQSLLQKQKESMDQTMAQQARQFAEQQRTLLAQFSPKNPPSKGNSAASAAATKAKVSKSKSSRKSAGGMESSRKGGRNIKTPSKYRNPTASSSRSSPPRVQGKNKSPPKKKKKDWLKTHLELFQRTKEKASRASTHQEVRKDFYYLGMTTRWNATKSQDGNTEWISPLTVSVAKTMEKSIPPATDIHANDGEDMLDEIPEEGGDVPRTVGNLPWRYHEHVELEHAPPLKPSSQVLAALITT